MTTSGCVLNLTLVDNKVELDPAFNGFERLSDFRQIPSSGALTLYILGHAVPNQLIDRQGNTLPEKILADAIRKARSNNPTLIIWDVCYSKSFEEIACAPFNSWGNNFIHIFSSQSYERTWRLPADTKGNGISLFSAQLAKAIAVTKKDDSWSALQNELRDRYGDLQTPEIVVENASTPSQYALPLVAPS